MATFDVEHFEKNVLRPYRLRINNSIKKFLDLQKDEFSGKPEFRVSYNNICNLCLNKGKMVRPTLVIKGYEAFGGTDIEAITDLSVSVELMHCYLLIHDDVMDKDLMRRGEPTVHHSYKLALAEYNLEKDLVEHTSNSLAILDGDILEALAYRPILDSPFAPELKVKAIMENSKTIVNTGLGQKLDVLSTIKKPSLEEIFHIARLKTAEYTIAKPLIQGGIFAGANDVELKTFYDYGYNTGIAFQLKDDELGLSPEKLNKGKNDISEGKMTAIIIRTYSELSEDERSEFDTLLGSKNPDEVKRALELIKKTDAITHNMQLYEEFANKACNTINNSNFNYETNEFFCNFAKYVVKRGV
jgi:geranylgeranyl pyrophosphate synthase